MDRRPVKHSRLKFRCEQVDKDTIGEVYEQVEQMETEQSEPTGPVDKVAQFQDGTDPMTKVPKPAGPGMDDRIAYNYIEVVKLKRTRKRV